jgi:hypothetical protein
MPSVPPYPAPELGTPYRPEPPPPAPAPRVSVLAAFKYVFAGEAPLASSFVLSFLFLIPIVGPIVLHGCQAAIVQRLVRRDAGPMPRVRFADVSPLLARGGASFVAELIVMFGSIVPFLSVFVPTIFLTSGQRGELRPVLGIVLAAAMLVFFLFLFPAWNAVVTRAALTENIGASLAWRATIAYVRRTWGTFLLAYLVFSLLSSGIILVGMLACGVGMYPAMVLCQLALAHLRWQIYESQRASGGAVIPLKEEAMLMVGAHAR